jgi:hypothetical protein
MQYQREMSAKLVKGRLKATCSPSHYNCGQCICKWLVHSSKDFSIVCTTRIVRRSNTVMTDCVVAYTRFDDISRSKLDQLLDTRTELVRTCVVMQHTCNIFAHLQTSDEQDYAVARVLHALLVQSRVVQIQVF